MFDAIESPALPLPRPWKRPGAMGKEGAPPFWGRAAGDWGNIGVSNEGAFAPPGLAPGWRRRDRAFDAACVELEQNLDKLVMQCVRQGALDGEGRAQGLCFRASRGFARPVDATPEAEPIETLSPEVAGAMIEAGLRAMNLPREELPALRHW